MLLSIIIATYNRADEVGKVIDELMAQFTRLKTRYPELSSRIELLIIDNNSKDQSKELIEEKIKSNRQLNSHLETKYFLEEAQGSSEARNRGIKEAQGNLIAFLDDDIELSNNLLKNLYELALKEPKDFCNGARVIPQWHKEPLPDWLSINSPFEIIQSCFPAHDHGEEQKAYPFVYQNGPRKVQNPISACFVASKDIFEKHGGFRLDLGIKAQQRGACEDTEFFWRIIKAGIKLEYNPQICVYHPIVEEKISKDFVLRWYKLLGTTLEYMKDKKLTHLNPNALVSSDLKLKIKLLLYKTLQVLSFAFLSPRRFFWFECQKAYTQGQIEYR